MIGGGPIPTDEKLYAKIKERVKKHFQKTSRWPSAYGSAHLVREYKKEFAKKYGLNKSPYKESKIKKSSKPKKSTEAKKSVKRSRCKNGYRKSDKGKCIRKKLSGGKIDCRMNKHKNNVICKNKSKKPVKSKKNSSGLTRWFDEKWVNLCKKKKDGSYASCGRNKSSLKNYPYCRPFYRINKGTPMTVGEMVKKYGKKKIEQMCKKKNSKKNVKSNTYM
tara:strand:- start:188 stop:844 length:657 start_codon:yes stop_codon:yes gene_type:complete